MSVFADFVRIKHSFDFAVAIVHFAFASKKIKKIKSINKAVASKTRIEVNYFFFFAKKKIECKLAN